MKRLAAMVILAALWTGSAGAECFNTTVNGHPYYICNPPIPQEEREFRYPFDVRPIQPPRNQYMMPWPPQPPNAGMNGLVPPSTDENMEGGEEE